MSSRLNHLSFVVFTYYYFAAFAYMNNYPWLEQMSRREEVTEACANIYNIRNNTSQGDTEKALLNDESLKHILVDHKHRLLYCYVPKVACTNWKRVLMVLTGVVNNTNPLEIPATVAHDERSTLRLSQLEQREIQRCLRQYTSFLVVRHPFERILSAYRNKFLGNTSSAVYFQERYGRRIIKIYRPNASVESLQTGKGVTFREFVAYLVKEGSHSNEHWAPIQALCQPCTVNYTLVSWYERMDEDASTVLGLIGAPPLSLPVTKAGGTRELLRHYFQQLSIREIEGLYRVYQEDFKLFGYGLENILGFDIG